jgi:hypothetical protein
MATSTKVMLAIVRERLSPWQSDTPKIAESSSWTARAARFKQLGISGLARYRAASSA